MSFEATLQYFSKLSVPAFRGMASWMRATSRTLDDTLPQSVLVDLSQGRYPARAAPSDKVGLLDHVHKVGPASIDRGTHKKLLGRWRVQVEGELERKIVALALALDRWRVGDVVVE
jgi:hypothetical protein